MTNKYPNIAKLYKSNWTNEDAQVLAEVVTESIHQNLDGWTSQEKSVIRKYLNDLGNAYQQSGGK